MDIEPIFPHETFTKQEWKKIKIDEWKSETKTKWVTLINYILNSQPIELDTKVHIKLPFEKHNSCDDALDVAREIWREYENKGWVAGLGYDKLPKIISFLFDYEIIHFWIYKPSEYEAD